MRSIDLSRQVDEFLMLILPPPVGHRLPLHLTYSPPVRTQEAADMSHLAARRKRAPHLSLRRLRSRPL